MISFQKTLQANTNDAFGYAVEAANLYEEITGAKVNVWRMLAGAPQNLVMWSQSAPTWAEVADNNAKVAVNQKWRDLMNRHSGAWSTWPAVSATDNVASWVARSKDWVDHGVGTVVLNSRVSLNQGADYFAAIGWLSEWCDFAARITGAQVAASVPMFGMSGFMDIGNFYANVKNAENGRSAGMASAEWLTKFTEGAKFFSGNIERVAAQRVA
jgi:hypothetical protein